VHRGPCRPAPWVADPRHRGWIFSRYRRCRAWLKDRSAPCRLRACRLGQNPRWFDERLGRGLKARRAMSPPIRPGPGLPGKPRHAASGQRCTKRWPDCNGNHQNRSDWAGRRGGPNFFPPSFGKEARSLKKLRARRPRLARFCIALRSHSPSTGREKIVEPKLRVGLSRWMPTGFPPPAG